MNKVLLVGRIANDIRTFSTPSGITYVRTSVAVTRRNSNDNITDFIPIVAWRQTADFISHYVLKGSLVSIEGSFTTSQYEGPNGIVRNYEVTVDNLSLLESKSIREQRTANTGAFNVPENKQNKTNSTSSKNFTFDTTASTSLGNDNEEIVVPKKNNKQAATHSFDILDDDEDDDLI